jgi:hypothetical protein
MFSWLGCRITQHAGCSANQQCKHLLTHATFNHLWPTAYQFPSYSLLHSVECDRVILPYESRPTSLHIPTATNRFEMPDQTAISSKSRTQRPLKRLDNNSMLLSKFKATDSDEKERRPRKTPSSGSGSSVPVEDEIITSKGSDQGEPYNSGSDEDTDDTLERIRYWSSPQRKPKKAPLVAKPLATPRTLRASRRIQGRAREPSPQPSAPSLGLVGDLQLRLRGFSISRPSSSGSDRGAKLIQ